jgi:hypothetical protein
VQINLIIRKLELGPNPVTYDPHTKILCVGYGGKGAGKDYGMVGIIDAKTDKSLRHQSGGASRGVALRQIRKDFIHVRFFS